MEVQEVQSEVVTEVRNDSTQLNPINLNAYIEQVEDREFTLGHDQYMENMQNVDAEELDGLINKVVQNADGEMGMIPNHDISFLPMTVNKFDILSMDNDEILEDGVTKGKFKDIGNKGEVAVVGYVGLWKDVSYGEEMIFDRTVREEVVVREKRCEADHMIAPILLQLAPPVAREELVVGFLRGRHIYVR
ncbi:hypothetical protein MA16_Dca017431 [Dendrobium catenatum]|uniref:Uncharacterized protein n=1 Tax=Dendrobium catenatum TaxID=906689 RepID=A0A2I0WZG7_9ASPA|nr:hypothetical protein MA16_Dca017431 [Dendrobium catenatum]